MLREAIKLQPDDANIYKQWAAVSAVSIFCQRQHSS